MQSPNFSAMHRKAAKNLEDSLRHFEESPPGVATEIVELKLQVMIFQYDICAEMVSFMRNKPTGFAASVAMKGLVLRLYEYDNLMNTTFIPRLLELADVRGITFDKVTVKSAQAAWKADLVRLKRWSNFRNKVAGHYDKDLRAQVALLKEIDPAVVLSVTRAFLSFNVALLASLRDAGKGVAIEV